MALWALDGDVQLSDVKGGFGHAELLDFAIEHERVTVLSRPSSREGGLPPRQRHGEGGDGYRPLWGCAL